MDLSGYSLAKISALLQKGEVTSVEVTNACLEEINKASCLNAFCWVDHDWSIEQAKQADKHLTNGSNYPLCGVPLGIKDLFCLNGVPTQAASKILEDFRPEYESTVTHKLKSQGAVFLGKTNMDEFAMGSSTEHTVYGPTINPWRKKNCAKQLTPGGSSGGSAAAVAAGLCTGALGTDTGGSIRQPASFTGIVGIKPTYGRCSRWGIVAFASSLDQAGPFARSVEDAALLLEGISGYDPKDSTSYPGEVPQFSQFLRKGVKGKTIGIPKEYRLDGMPEIIETVWQKGAKLLQDEGAQIVEISLPHTQYALPAYYIIAPAEASSNLARYDGVRYGRRAKLKSDSDIIDMYKMTRSEGFGPEVKRRVLIGTYVLSQGFYEAYYRRAQKVRTLIKQDFERVFSEGIDAILTPTTPGTAFGIGEFMNADPIQMYLNDVFTVTVNLAGLPGISVPAQLDDNGLPLGLQLIGQPWQEGELLSIAATLEGQLNFKATPEKWWKKAK
ncbi:MAG: Asp-tRNA(Asn)/Glu-tRNA(Gln) amidotransferase subunit GatA [Rhodobacteraceae bacterium]|nr:Asp-tRNA(Asn)/Glu-tRNA(Gln) amidotransferase subunit GatA [Paracoccaceae bacterium]